MFDDPPEHHQIYHLQMERTQNHKQPVERGPPIKTHRPDKEGIKQGGSTETKVNPEGVAETEVSVHGTTISRTLHRAGLYGRVAQKSHYLVLRFELASQ